MSLRNVLGFFLLAVISVAAFAKGGVVEAGVVEVGVAKSAEDVCPIKVGQTIPEASLRTIEGQLIQLKGLVGKKPTLLIFYRGGWCPYCNIHLGELKTIEDSLLEMGVQIVGVSPDLPANLRKSVEKQTLKYALLSDSQAEAIKAFGLAFKVGDGMNKKLLSHNINLEAASGETHRILPVPAAFLIDTDGTVRFAFSSPNYKVRVSPAVLMAAVKTLVNDQKGQFSGD